MNFIDLIFESNAFDLKPDFLGKMDSDYPNTPVMVWKSGDMYFVFDLEHEKDKKATYHRGPLEEGIIFEKGDDFPFSKLSYKELKNSNAIKMFSLSANMVKEFLKSNPDFTVKVEGARRDNETTGNHKTTRTQAFERACKNIGLSVEEDKDKPNTIYIKK